MLIDHHLARLAEDGRSSRTIDAYRYTASKFMRFVGGVRVREATPPRIDAALRSMRNATGATALTADELRGLLAKLATSQEVTDPVASRTASGGVLRLAHGPTLRPCATSRPSTPSSGCCLAIRRMVREKEGRPPSTARIDELLDERSSLLPPTPGESPASK